MLEQTNVKEIQDAVMIVRRISADERIKEIARRRELALHEEASAISGAREEAKAEGIEIGRAEERELFIAKMRKRGMTEEEIRDFLDS